MRVVEVIGYAFRGNRKFVGQVSRTLSISQTAKISAHPCRFLFVRLLRISKSTAISRINAEGHLIGSSTGHQMGCLSPKASHFDHVP